MNTYTKDMYGPTTIKSVFGVTKVGTSSFPSMKTYENRNTLPETYANEKFITVASVRSSIFIEPGPVLRLEYILSLGPWFLLRDEI